MSVNPFGYLQRNAERSPSGVFVRSASAVVTNAEAAVSATKLAYELRRLGLRAGDIVALDLPEQLQLIATEALFHEGAIGTVLPPGYTPDGIVPVRWNLTTGRQPTPRDAEPILVDRAFLRRVEENPYGIRPTSDAPDAVRILFSSGTTGVPHAIAHGSAAMEALSDALETWFRGDPFLVLSDAGTAWGFGGFFLSVAGGKPFLSTGGAGQSGLLRLIREQSVTSLKGSPAQLAALVAQAESEVVTLPSVTSTYYGGTAMPPGLRDRLRILTDGCEIIGTYGSTEATIATVRTSESEDPSDAGTVIRGSELQIVDDEDRPVPVGRPGRIRHRSDGMAHGYIGDPAATARAFRDGWFYSGDLGILRPDGGLTLTGRETEVLNAGGVKVDPVRVDHAALHVAGVVDACSFAYDGTDGVARIGLAYVGEAGVEVGSDELISALRGELGSAAPSLIARIDRVPRNALGKPLRRELADRLGGS